MPLDFPASPSVNDTYTFSGRTWKWNGSGWQLTSPYSNQDYGLITGSASGSLDYGALS